MKQVSYFLLSCWALLLFANCNTKQEADSVMEKMVFPISVKHTSAFTGKWIYNNTIWDSFDLQLANDNTFTFSSQNCLGIQLSKGKWKEENGIIKLISFEEFKDQPSPVLFGSKDTSRIYFNAIQLQLKNDTLASISADEIFKGVRFHRVQNKF